MLKYISIGLLLVFTSILGGCNLDTDDESKLPGDKFWTGPQANAHAFMLSIYQSLRKATTSNGFFSIQVMYVVHLSQGSIRMIIYI